MTPTEDGRLVLFLRATPQDPRSSLWEVDVATGVTRELLRPESLVAGPETLTAEEKARRERQRIRGGGFTFFEPSPDGAVIVVGLSGKLYAWKRATGKARELPTGPGAIDPHLSPDATKIAYVRDNDVYVLSVDGGANEKPVAITRGGTETNPHGVADFMAQEEFYRHRGFWWSPDGSEILYEDADLSKVEKWTLADPGKPEAPPQIVAYPQTGKAHAVVRLAIAQVGAQVGAQVRAPGRPARKITWDMERYPYLVSVRWTKNAPLTLHVMDRPWRNAAVLAVDEKTGATKALLTEEDAVWLTLDTSVPRWLPDGSAFLWSTERSGDWELELRDRQGAKISTVAAQAMGYRNLLGVDAEKKVAYVRASAEPIRDELWAAPWGGGAPRPILRNADSVFYAGFGHSPRVYSFMEGTPGGERRFGVRSVDGSVNIAVPSEAEAPPFKVNIELTKVGKDEYRALIIRPRSFDKQRRYPVIDYIYAGPGTNMVSADARRYLQQQWLADVTQSIVVGIDARGSGRRGRAWERAAFDHFGDLAVNEHASSIGELAKTYPEMDATRVGVYGWSHGGYSTAMAILRRPDVFKVGVSGAPVADLRDYDALMERFLGLAPNPAYDESSLLTWAARPPTAASPARPLLLIHGTADDNVYLVHSLKFAEAMARAGRPMEFMPLIGQTHMISTPDAAAAVAKRTAEFFREHLR
jgi:dipeptidyl-peptidase-4